MMKQLSQFIHFVSKWRDFNWIKNNQSSGRAQRTWEIPFDSFLFAFLFLFLFSLYGTFWSDSEIWGLRQAEECVGDWRNYACGLKPAFHIMYGLVAWLSKGQDVATLILQSRIFFGILMCGAFLLFWVRSIEKAALVCIFGTSFFLLDMNHARSDPTTLPFLILFVYFLERTFQETEKKIKWAWAAAFAGIWCILITPKIGFVLVALLPLMFQAFRPIWKFQKPSKKAIGLCVGSLVALLLLLDLREALPYFFNMFDAEGEGVPYWHRLRFAFVIRTLKENPHFLALLCLPYVLLVSKNYVRQILDFNSLQFGRFFSSLLVLAVLFFYPEKLPFFNGTLFLLWAYLVLPLLLGPWPVLVTVRLLGVVAIFTGVVWGLQSLTITNEEQVRNLNLLDKYIAQVPDARVFDSLGLVRSQKLPWIFLGPAQIGKNDSNIQRVFDEDFGVVLITKKLFAFWFQFQEHLDGQYVERIPGLWVQSVPITVASKQTLTFREVTDRINEQMYGHLKEDSPVYFFFQAKNPMDDDKFRYNRTSTIKSTIKPDEVLCGPCPPGRLLVSPFGGDFRAFGWPRFDKIFQFEHERRRMNGFEVIQSIEQKFGPSAQM